MTEDAIDRMKATQRQRRYEGTEGGKAARARDKERIRRGYHALRAMGVPCKEALKGARKAARELAAKEAENGAAS